MKETIALYIARYGYWAVLKAFADCLADLRAQTHNIDEQRRLDNLRARLPEIWGAG